MGGVERKLTVLFADVSGSTKLYEKLGDAEALRAVDRCLKRMERAIDGFRGRLVKTVGDEIMAVFETAEDAFQAAVEMQLRVSDLPPVSGVKLAIRVGFHSGSVSEEAGEVTGDTVNAAARIVGGAKSEQILASLHTVNALPHLLRESVHAVEIGGHDSGGIFEVAWRHPDEQAAKPAPAPAQRLSRKLCVRYRGRAYLLDEKTPFLTLGRDQGNDLIIEDRKASRLHARIERRGDKFVYVDQSTNGSYITLAGEPEMMLRRHELPLSGSGSVCFGSSANDPLADCAQFEPL